jgi:hypothetical protein
MSYDESDAERERQEQALEELIQDSLPDAIWQQSVDIAARFLRTYGDAVQDRIARALKNAKDLSANGHNEAALVRAFAAIELTISYLLFRPLFMGALLSEDLADAFVKSMFDKKNGRERNLLPTVLKHYGIALDQISLPDGRPLWKTITDAMYERRNKVVHCGASATLADCSDAIMAAELLLDRVVAPLAKQFGFTLETTGKWSEIGLLLQYRKAYPTKNPFQEPN